MAKVSISIDEADLLWLRRRAKRLYGGNLSSAVAEATRLMRHNEAMGALLDRLGAPELSPVEVDLLAADLDGRPRHERARRRREA